VTATLEPAPTPAPARARRFRRRPPAGLAAAGFLTAALFALPLGYLLWHDLRLGGGFFDVLADEDVDGPLLRTLTLAATVSAGATALGTLLAWLLTRTDLPGRRLWRVLVPLPLVIPSFVGAFALIAAFAPGGLVATLLGIESLPRIEGLWAAWLVVTLLTYPYVYLPVAARLESLPRSLEESARALGRSPREVFRTVVLPQCTGAMWAGALLVFLYCLAEFGAVQLLHYDTLTRAIFSSWLFDRDVALALSLVLAAVALVVVLFERRIARRRVQTEASARAAGTAQSSLGRWKAPALGLVGGVVGLALLVPVAVLTHWTVRGLLGDAELHAGDLARPALNTAGLGIVTAIFAVAVMLPVAFLTIRHRSVSGEVANAVVVSGFALPGLVIAIAFVFFVVQSPLADLLYQTYALLVVVYAVHFGSQSLRAAQVAVGGVPRRIEDAARSLGAGRVQRLLTVQLPLMRPGLVAGGGLVLLSTMKELPATLVLAPTGTETLATAIWSARAEGFFAQAGLASLALLAVSGALTWLLVVRPAEHRR
jgi:iron(III) transport system permease protein